ncbi:MAG TPA: YciI family protein [Kofleriaceae bacterium]|nr:YciI family protein [Kofleriaceae bacterium]
MMIVKANQDSEAGVMPSENDLAAMARYNEQLTRAGVLLDGTGLTPSSQGARVRFSAGGVRRVIDGPFTEAKELIAGYWLIQVKSRDEAIEWAKRIPFEPDPKTGAEPEVELRRLFELDDFAPGPAIDHHRAVQQQLEQNK